MGLLFCVSHTHSFCPRSVASCFMLDPPFCSVFVPLCPPPFSREFCALSLFVKLTSVGRSRITDGLKGRVWRKDVHGDNRAQLYELFRQIFSHLKIYSFTENCEEVFWSAGKKHMHHIKQKKNRGEKIHNDRWDLQISCYFGQQHILGVRMSANNKTSQQNYVEVSIISVGCMVICSYPTNQNGWM